MWQEKLKTQVDPEPRNGRRWRNQTNIKPSDVEMALQLKKETSNISATYLTPETTKVRNHLKRVPFGIFKFG